LEIAIKHACKSIPKLNIPKDATAITKIRELVATFHASKDEISKVTFNFQMKTLELELKLQPTTPPEVQEKHKAMITTKHGKTGYRNHRLRNAI